MSMSLSEPSTSRRGPDRRVDPARPGDPATADASPLLWSLQDVARALSVSRRTLERLVAAGRFPKADVQIGKMPRWKPQTVRNWVDRRA